MTESTKSVTAAPSVTPTTNGHKPVTREQIKAADDYRTEWVPTPEWGGDVLVKSLTGHERDAYEATVVEYKGDKRKVNLTNLRARFVQRTAINEDGTLLFGEADIPWLTKKNAKVLERVFKAAQSLSGMTDEDMDELLENLDPAASEN
jgi:hypothetical protein